jgi:hypothetical protein
VSALDDVKAALAIDREARRQGYVQGRREAFAKAMADLNSSLGTRLGNGHRPGNELSPLARKALAARISLWDPDIAPLKGGGA